QRTDQKDDSRDGIAKRPGELHGRAPPSRLSIPGRAPVLMPAARISRSIALKLSYVLSRFVSRSSLFLSNEGISISESERSIASGLTCSRGAIFSQAA